ncbi:MAG: hypothetical protein H6670_16130 [Anaerolineaceae bacterium]|nr:hypothetical protein [Anaerolineaceae bacterium]
MPQSTNNLLDNAFGEPDINVNSTLDAVDANPGDGICADVSGNCTLRAAIMESNVFPLTQTIHVPAGTYLLTIPGTDEDAAATGDLDITDPLLLIGDGQGETIIDGNDLDRVFDISDFVAFDYLPYILLTNMTIQGGNAPYGGGVLINEGTISFLQLVTLRDNYAYGQHPCGQSAGAAIYSEGPLSYIYDSLITQNRTPNSDITSSYGAVSGYLDLIRSSVVNNDTDWAIIADRNACTIYEDLGFFRESLIANNSGGGFYLNRSISLKHTTISGNAAGITVDYTEAVPLAYDPALEFVTIADNGSYGLKINYPTRIQLGQSIISGHSQDCDVTGALSINPNYKIDYWRYGYNLISDDSCPLTDSTSRSSVDPQLLPLSDNGGYTLTRTIGAASPAIGAVPNCDRMEDQRGPLPYDSENPACTIGAFEYNDGGTDFAPRVNLQIDFDNPTQIIFTKHLYLGFSAPMYDPPGDTHPDDVTNPENYLLFLPGTDAGYETVACNGSIRTQAVSIPIVRVVYGEPWPVNYSDPSIIFRSGFMGAMIEFDPQALGENEYILLSGNYALRVCDNIRDIKGIQIDGDGDWFSGGNRALAFYHTGPVLPQVKGISVTSDGDPTLSQIYPGAEPSIEVSSSVDLFEISFLDSRMDGYTLTDPANIQLISGGDNAVVETVTCANTSGDDVFVSLSKIDGGFYTDFPTDFVEGFAPFKYLRFSPSDVLSANAYRLLLCDDIISLEHIPLDGDFNGIPGGNFMLDFVTNGFVPTLLTPSVPTLNDYSDVLVALNLPTVSDVPAGTVFQIERTTGVTPTIVGSVDVGTTSFVDSNLICETAYRYRIRLYDAANSNFSGWSDYLDVTTANCVTSLQHTFGLYKEGQWLFYAVDGYQREDVRFQFGPLEAGWTALVGDWNGDGLPGIGLYKDGTFLLRDISGNSVVDISFNFGPATGAIPIIGDWDGNGTDTIGVFSSGSFQLRNSNDAGPADLTFSLGSASSIPLAGDWDGDGTDSVGYFENNTFYLATAGPTPTVYTSFSFGPLGWSPVFGDWNGDLTDTIGLYNNGLWRLRNSNSTGSVDYGFSYGDLTGGWQPLAFDGDTSVLNRLFAATVPTPRVPVIPGPELSITLSAVPTRTLPPPTATSYATPTSEPFSCDRISVNDLGYGANSITLTVRNDNDLDAILTGSELRWNDSIIKPDYPNIYLGFKSINGEVYWSGTDNTSPTNTFLEGTFISNANRTVSSQSSSYWEATFVNGPIFLQQYLSPWDFSNSYFYFDHPTEHADCEVPLTLDPEPEPTNTLDASPTRPTSTPYYTPSSGPFSCDRINVYDLGYGANSITLTVRNDNDLDAVLTGSELRWNDSIIKPDYPNIYLGFKQINGEVYWSGTDNIPPTNSFLEGTFFSSANRIVSSQSIANWEAVFVNGPVFLQQYLYPWDFSNSYFYFDHPTEHADCEVPLTLDPEPGPTNTPGTGPTPPTSTNTPSICELDTVDLEFVSFDPLGDVRLQLKNNLPVSVTISNFNIVWPAVPGLSLQRVVYGGESVNDLPPNGTAVIFWENLAGGDTISPTQGDLSSDGNWLQNISVGAGESKYIHLDFTGTGAPSLDSLGVVLADFYGTYFSVDCQSEVFPMKIWLDTDTLSASNSVRMTSAPAQDTSWTATPLMPTYQPISPSPVPSMTASLTPSPTFIPSITPSPGNMPPTATPTSTNTQYLTPTLSP